MRSEDDGIPFSNPSSHGLLNAPRHLPVINLSLRVASSPFLDQTTSESCGRRRTGPRGFTAGTTKFSFLLEIVSDVLFRPPSSF